MHIRSSLQWYAVDQAMQAQQQGLRQSDQSGPAFVLPRSMKRAGAPEPLARCRFGVP